MIKFPGISTCREHVNLFPPSGRSPPLVRVRHFRSASYSHPLLPPDTYISPSPFSPPSLPRVPKTPRNHHHPLFLFSAYPRNHPLEQPARARVVEINCTRSAQQHRRVRASPTLSLTPTRHWHLRPRIYQSRDEFDMPCTGERKGEASARCSPAIRGSVVSYCYLSWELLCIASWLRQQTQPMQSICFNVIPNTSNTYCIIF